MKGIHNLPPVYEPLMKHMHDVQHVFTEVITYDDTGDVIFSVPANLTLIGIGLEVDTAFDAGSLKLGDGTTTDKYGEYVNSLRVANTSIYKPIGITTSAAGNIVATISGAAAGQVTANLYVKFN